MTYYIKTVDENEENESDMTLFLDEGGAICGDINGYKHKFTGADALSKFMQGVGKSEACEVKSHIENRSGLTLFHKNYDLLYITAYSNNSDNLAEKLLLRFCRTVDFDDFNLAVIGLYANHKLGKDGRK